MKQVVNNLITFKGFAAINICGILFVRKKQTSEILLQHEEIHTKQMQELLHLFFYLAYLLEWILWFSSINTVSHIKRIETYLSIKRPTNTKLSKAIYRKESTLRNGEKFRFGRT